VSKIFTLEFAFLPTTQPPLLIEIPACTPPSVSVPFFVLLIATLHDPLDSVFSDQPQFYMALTLAPQKNNIARPVACTIYATGQTKPPEMTMFNPTREQVREFFIENWRKYQAQEVLTAIETVAAGIMLEHPEYHALLASPEAMTKEFSPEHGQSNPFLHMSLHLSVEEQLSIDQPPGIRAAFETLRRIRGDRHNTMHDVIECLGETMFKALRDRTSPDGVAYLNSIRRRAGMPQIAD
jgi:hypothetical protein